jgi:hypothetical protein
VDTASLDVNSIAHAVCFLLGVFLLGIGNRELSFEDQMGRQESVRVRAVVGVPVANCLSAL